MASEQMKAELASANLNLLKVMLRNFIKNYFTPCDGFLKELMDCTDEKAIKTLFLKYNEEVFEELGDPESEDEVDKLERRISRLERDNEDLEEKLAECESLFGTSLNDEYKRNFFGQYHNNYTPWELEELLKNGHKFLKNGII